MQNSHRMDLSNKKRIVIKIGSTSLTHPETGAVNLGKIEQLARQISDLKGRGKEVVLVTSGAVAAGKQTFGKKGKLASLAEKQACAAVGQAKLMMVYQRLFAEYSMTAAQILLTRFTMQDEEARSNAHNTFDELLKMGAVPIVNENDTVSTYEIRFGDNDRLCALSIVTSFRTRNYNRLLRHCPFDVAFEHPGKLFSERQTDNVRRAELFFEHPCRRKSACRNDEVASSVARSFVIFQRAAHSHTAALFKAAFFKPRPHRADNLLP